MKEIDIVNFIKQLGSENERLLKDSELNEHQCNTWQRLAHQRADTIQDLNKYIAAMPEEQKKPERPNARLRSVIVSTQLIVSTATSRIMQIPSDAVFCRAVNKANGVEFVFSHPSFDELAEGAEPEVVSGGSK